MKTTILALALAGCSSIDCEEFSDHQLKVWDSNPSETMLECLTSEVQGPYLRSRAVPIAHNFNVKGMCQEPGAYVVSDYETERSQALAIPDQYFVFCPRGRIRE